MDARSMPKSPRRSLLFTPGDSIRKMRKAAQVGTDMVILDLEDAVAPGQKEEARLNVVDALDEIAFGRTELLVRVNAPDSDFIAADLEAIARTTIDGIVVPKVETAEQVQTIDKFLTAGELAGGQASGGIRLFALIETALGIMNIKEIGQSSRRLEGLMFGAEDLAVDIRATRSKEGWEVFYGRSAIVTAAAAYGLEAIDMVYLDLPDLSGLEKEALFARQMGYTGKMAIHPRQVEVINRVFSPTKEEIAVAERLLQSYQTHTAAGTGVFTLNGRMVDKPVVRAAENLLDRARLSGLLDDND
ncbi:MAG: citrate (pro-3S)-lyase subunit beta [Anaerolineae bacterium]|nr:MAG: citrate (pro-3S)-lyase subunit beta [Anaerolineae bacterium]